MAPGATGADMAGVIWASVHGLASLWIPGTLGTAVGFTGGTADLDHLVGDQPRAPHNPPPGTHEGETTMTTTESPWLRENFAPVHEEVTAFDLPVTGTLPPELEGRFLRNGPNPVSVPDPAAYHWFTGTGMVHGLRLRDGQAEWYRNRYVRTPETAIELGEEPPPNPYGDEVRIFAANTNVIGHAGTTLAIVEAGAPPIELGYELDTIRVSRPRRHARAPLQRPPQARPPHRRAARGRLLLGLGQPAALHRGGRRRPRPAQRRRGRPRRPDGPRLRHHRVAGGALRPAVHLRPRGGHERRLPLPVEPDYGARVGLLPRDGEAQDVRWFEVEPCYVFHPLNAYDRPDGSVVLDVVRHPKMFASDVHGPNEGGTRLDRWTIDVAAGKVIEETLDDRPQEFPRHDERILGRPHRYGYGAWFGPEAAAGPALKHDLERGTTEVHDYGTGRASGELVFVPRSDDAAEDDGWLLSFVYDATTDRSDLVVLHAQDFTGDPVATVHLPQRVPFGFHGNWVPDPA
jgi:carotenoid cleavage oxygenase